MTNWHPNHGFPLKFLTLLTTSYKTKLFTVHTRSSLWSVLHEHKRAKNIVKNVRALPDDNFSYFLVKRVSPCNRRHCSPRVFKPALRRWRNAFEFRNGPIIFSSPVHSRSSRSYEPPLPHTSLRVALLIIQKEVVTAQNLEPTGLWYVIYLLTAIGLSPGGRSTVHIYTQYIERYKTINTQNNTTIGECGPCPVLASYTLAFALQPRKKHGKISVKVAASKNT
jgi:hypothetical protein